MEKEIKVRNLFIWIWFRLYSKLWKSFSMFNSARFQWLILSPVFWKGEGRRLNKDRINASPQTKLCWSLSLQHPVHAHPFPVVNVKHIDSNFHFIVHFSVHFILHWPENVKSITISAAETKLALRAQRRVKRSCHFVWQRCEWLLRHAELLKFQWQSLKCHRWPHLHFRVFCCVVTQLEQRLFFHLFVLLGTSRTSKFCY